jgi:hypothetical protein
VLGARVHLVPPIDLDPARDRQRLRAALGLALDVVDPLEASSPFDADGLGVVHEGEANAGLGRPKAFSTFLSTTEVKTI